MYKNIQLQKKKKSLVSSNPINSFKSKKIDPVKILA